MQHPDPGTLASTTLSPRGRVLFDGRLMPAPENVEVSSESHFVADTFRVEWPITSLPPDLQAPYWSSVTAGVIDISVGYADETGAVSAWADLIVGQVDDIEWNMETRALTLTGRDLSARLIDAKTSEKFANQTASQIAATLAARHGLLAVVQPTTTKAGTYYQIDDTVLTSEQTEWDILKALAEHEGFDVWVSGRTLFFQPPPGDDNPYLLVWSDPQDGTPPRSNAHLRFKRSLTIAQDIEVIVRSRNQAQGRTFETTYKVSRKRGPHQSKPQVYSYVVPNLTKEQVIQFAKSKAEEITRNERLLFAEMPGDDAMSTRRAVKVVGTGTEWDQLYYPSTIMRSMSVANGFRMSLQAKNHSPQDTVVL